jgi:Tfp pilus assembly PilM family ATPase
LPEEKAYLFTTSIPKVAQKDIRSAIEFKMEENVPIPASDLVFDFLVCKVTLHTGIE